MSKHNDGGPAFPRPISEDRTSGDLQDGNDMIPAQEGMSLRDWFAGKALAGTAIPFDARLREEAAGQFYKMADAMLGARDGYLTTEPPVLTVPKGCYAVSDGEMMLLFEPAEEGGFTITCPAIKGLNTEADTIQDGFLMARDAAETLRAGRSAM